ncbi:recombinase family protein [Enterobacter roggenkampii]|uniref:recombinase family protein n=1 Tax=Enterobacter roggenkampii TaxID=1812935 RepID=UPI001C7051B9|nr:recombinase family protein [Enterobacter roggenkampii]MBW9464615.1 recombinase family protein [Enterobacter roggenkampii]
MRIYGYLRASTEQQDALRGKADLDNFASVHNLKVSKYFIENVSGATLQRPELFRLLDIAEPGDVLACEQIDRLARLNAEDWRKLRTIIESKGIRVVSLDLPTSHQLLLTNTDSFTSRMVESMNTMMLDMLAAIARKDYEDRRRRQQQGISKAKELGKYKGRPIDQSLHQKIRELLSDGKSWNKIQDMLECSRATIAKVVKMQKNKQEI